MNSSSWLKDASLATVLAFFVFTITSAAISEEDFDTSLSHVGRQFLVGLGLNANFVFTVGTNYPPISDDVSFRCIKPGGDEFKRVLANASAQDLKNAIDTKLPINFLVHGYLDSFHGGFMKTDHVGWMDSTARAWSKQTSSNVCAIDWSRLASYAYTITATMHTRKVAAHLVDFIKMLVSNGAKVGEMSISGHSLGAQIAGFAGFKLKGELKAIYGLDPAGPGFRVPFAIGRASHLDDSDAKYVQCIHTARFTLGVNFDCGHADFYPNGGIMMPGCIEPICSHLRVVALFRSSIDPAHSFVGTHCFSDILARLMRFRCTSTQENMGIHNKGVKGSFYLYTTRREPYCFNCSTKKSTDVDAPPASTAASAPAA